MRFSTGSSSSSLASDSLSRKSTLCIYTEGDPPSLLCEKMDSGSEAMELRRELDTVRSALQSQSESVLKQRHQLVEAGHKLAARDLRADRERRLRQDQLALVLRSLVLLESRLTREQKKIHVALQQKEKIIEGQRQEISKLKARKLYCSGCRQVLGFTSEQTNIETDPEFQSLESTDSRYQNGFARSCSYHERNVPPMFQKNTRLSQSFQLPKNDVVYGNTSSSEEGNATVAAKGTYIKNKQAFIRKDVTRRSRKFSGRKHNSAYLDDVKKRSSSQANSSSAEECIGMSYQVNREDDATANHIADDIRRASLRIDQLIEENTKDNESENNDKSFAYKMENMHGIKRQVSDEINANRTMFLNNVLNEDAPSEKPWYVNVSDPEPEIENNYSTRPGKLNTKSKSADNLLVAGFNDGILNAEVISAKNEILCNSLTKSVKRDKFGQIKSYNKDRNPSVSHKEFASEANENWYASASDMDDGPTCEIYKNNPVLECVNQILLQNSLDESSNETSKSSDAPSPKSSAKRVQFSTLNTISFDDTAGDNGQSHTLPRQNGHDRRLNKIVKFSLETASEHSYEVPNTAQGFNYEIQSIYSNDYEPIVTKSQESHRPIPLPRTLTTNFNAMNQVPVIKGSVVKNIAANIENRNNATQYPDKDLVTMKIVNKRKVPRTPPALPPKPKNLVSKFKFEKDSIIRPPTENNSDAVAANQRVTEVKTRKVGQVATVINAVEPDYCSISEINVPVVSNGKRELLLSQPTVEIHNHSEQYLSQPIVSKNNVAKVISLPRIQSKMSDQDIPMLPQVTEIIIPDEDDSKLSSKSVTSPSIGGCDSYMLSNLINQTPPKLEQRNSIQMGNSVSSILSEINRGAKSTEKLVVLTELDHQYNRAPADVPHNSTPPKLHERNKSEYFDDIDRFDLSQNFEEFKIDECDMGNIAAEEYHISSSSSDGAGSDVATEEVSSAVCELASLQPTTIIDNVVKDNYRIEIIPNKNFIPNQGIELDSKSQDPSVNSDYCKSKLSNKPDLLSNIENVEIESVRNSDIESSNSSGSNSGSYNTVKCEPGIGVRANESGNVARKNNISFDFFLESSGLSSKSLVPSDRFAGLPPPVRPPSANHKNILRPRDIKMRVKNQLTSKKINEKPMTTAIKYFEPYL